MDASPSYSNRSGSSYSAPRASSSGGGSSYHGGGGVGTVAAVVADTAAAAVDIGKATNTYITQWAACNGCPFFALESQSDDSEIQY